MSEKIGVTGVRHGARLTGKMATQTSAISPDIVGRAFVKQYYGILLKLPHEAHRFYKDESVVSWPQADGEVKSVTTTAGIREFIMSSSHLKYSKVELTTVDSQESSLGGVVVVVTARLVGQHNSRKRFSQTFFLAPQSKGFFVLNDIFRFVDAKESSSVVDNMIFRFVDTKESSSDVDDKEDANGPVASTVEGAAKENRTEETDGEAKTLFEELPDDYDNWSSTVIFFKENDNWDISVYAFDCDNCCGYYVMTYDFRRIQIYDYKLGYTASDFKLYFVGDVRYDEHDGVEVKIYDPEIKVYDIRIREWVKGFPKLKAHICRPTVFSLDERLYVLSSGSYYQEEQHLEMLDMNNLSRGWISLPKPLYKKNQRSPGYIIDYSKKMLYIRFEDSKTLYSYDFHDSRWNVHYYKFDSPLPARTGNLWKFLWSNDCEIVENYLYGFTMGTLFVRDLEIENGKDTSVGRWVVDISSIVTPDDKWSYGSLVYLGKRNSCQRFFLLIWYKCGSCSGDYHVGTCTFDLRRSSSNLNQATAIGGDPTNQYSFIAEPISYHYPHKEFYWGVEGYCYKLCEVKR